MSVIAPQKAKEIRKERSAQAKARSPEAIATLLCDRALTLMRLRPVLCASLCFYPFAPLFFYVAYCHIGIGARNNVL